MTKGIRITQAGTSVTKAADYQKTMDERWPIVEHQFMGIVNLENISTATPGALTNPGGTIVHVPIYRHNLGFLPAFRAKHISYSGFEAFNTPIQDLLFADTENIYLTVYKSVVGSITISAKFFLAVMDRDCTQEYQAPIDIVTALQTSKPSKYGLKILNGPGNIDDKDKSKFTLNTNAKSLQLQQTGIREASATSIPAYNIVIDHRLGYPPTYFVAPIIEQTGTVNPSLGKTTIGALGAGTGLSRSNSITLTIRGAQAALQGRYMFVILKDPVDTAK